MAITSQFRPAPRCDGIADRMCCRAIWTHPRLIALTAKSGSKPKPQLTWRSPSRPSRPGLSRPSTSYEATTRESRTPGTRHEAVSLGKIRCGPAHLQLDRRAIRSWRTPRYCGGAPAAAALDVAIANNLRELGYAGFAFASGYPYICLFNGSWEVSDDKRPTARDVLPGAGGHRRGLGRALCASALVREGGRFRANRPRQLHSYWATAAADAKSKSVSEEDLAERLLQLVQHKEIEIAKRLHEAERIIH
jgi:hypothetical protein